MRLPKSSETSEVCCGRRPALWSPPAGALLYCALDRRPALVSQGCSAMRLPKSSETSEVCCGRRPRALAASRRGVALRRPGQKARAGFAGVLGDETSEVCCGRRPRALAASRRGVVLLRPGQKARAGFAGVLGDETSEVCCGKRPRPLATSRRGVALLRPRKPALVSQGCSAMRLRKSAVAEGPALWPPPAGALLCCALDRKPALVSQGCSAMRLPKSSETSEVCCGRRPRALAASRRGVNAARSNADCL